ncbi:hypothetical protein [Chryseolinea lacunae]|uniref:DUF4280 domain-containing protein n=1 Tax=Chryseolinea lacunae TaxID=2801331 RepID=A0ABS1KSB2_9BACT|nr:hypothetical protein [Chryseolinea lacunae]MBL0742368.1 hypothetical protein [Chryseolinea lacunae]
MSWNPTPSSICHCKLNGVAGVVVTAGSSTNCVPLPAQTLSDLTGPLVMTGTGSMVMATTSLVCEQDVPTSTTFRRQ